MSNILSQSFIVSNVDTETKIKRETFDDVEHLVVPVIAAKEMVMNGLLYPAEEFKDWVSTWNGVPVPVRHPQVNGLHVSAKSPRIHEQNNIGWFYNVDFTKDNKLKGEIWLNLDKVEKLKHMDIVEKLEKGEIVEVSTGLFSNIEDKKGTFNGVPYDGIVRHIRPDHLALLPDDIGACSIKDGCGALKNNCECEEPKTIIDKFNKALRLVGDKLGLSINKDSFDEIHSKLMKALQIDRIDADKMEYVYIVDIFVNEYIYSTEKKGVTTLYKRSYIIQDDKAVLGDDPQEVVRKTTYTPIIKSNEAKIKGDDSMDKSELVQSIIDNESTSFTIEDKESLEALEVNVLAKIQPIVNETVTIEQEPEQAPEEEKTTSQKVNSLLEGVEDSEVKEFLGNAVSKHNTEKTNLISDIVKNSEFTTEELEAMHFNQIEKLAKSLKKPDYSGRSGRSVSTVNSQETYQAPSIFKKGE